MDFHQAVIAVMAAILEAGDRTRTGPVEAPRVYTDRAADLWLAADETCMTHPANIRGVWSPNAEGKV